MVVDSLEFRELNSVQPEPETVEPSRPGKQRSRMSASLRLLTCRRTLIRTVLQLLVFAPLLTSCKYEITYIRK